MKLGITIFYTIIFLGLSAFGFALIVLYSTSMSISELIAEVTPSVQVDQPISKCNDKVTIDNLNASIDSHIEKLNEYQAVCNSFVSNELMIFMDMPKDTKIAKSKADELTKTLKEFNSYGIKPIVIVEPVTEWGLIDFEEFDSGFYDSWIEDFFKQLKANEVTKEMIGTWVPFPEANLPYWNRANATPQQFSSVVNKYLRILKKYYPDAKGSVLLNSATYESTDFNWENGEYVSLKPYVENLDKTLVNSFGIQGFPWRSPATQKEARTIYDANEFINPPLVTEAANILGTNEVWINTGSFSSKYTLDSNSIVFVDPSTRKSIMNSITAQALKLKAQGFNIKINLFSEDKSSTEEATNWSYWGNYNDLEDPNIYIFKDFVKKLNENNIELSLFDSTRLSEYAPDRDLR